MLSPQVYDIFRHISSEDLKYLGFNSKLIRPEHLITTVRVLWPCLCVAASSWDRTTCVFQVLPVPPPPVRPSVAFDGVNRGDDDLTHKYASIIKANNALLTAKKGNAPEVKMVAFENTLQYEVATLVDNSIPGQGVDSQRSGRPLKTIRERLVGKGGRIRGNLMGKRVDFSGRTVITADPNLSIEQVGVPRSIALNLTVPERVTRFNFDRLQKLVANGPKVHPGGRSRCAPLAAPASLCADCSAPSCCCPRRVLQRSTLSATTTCVLTFVTRHPAAT